MTVETNLQFLLDRLADGKLFTIETFDDVKYGIDNNGLFKVKDGKVIGSAMLFSNLIDHDLCEADEK